MVELLDSISKYDVILPKSINETNEEMNTVLDQVDESRLPLTLDSDDMREVSVNTSDDIIGIALIEAYPQEVNVVENFAKLANFVVTVTSLCHGYRKTLVFQPLLSKPYLTFRNRMRESMLLPLLRNSGHVPH